jgi:glycerol-3-phosphate acyltransferase PlsY
MLILIPILTSFFLGSIPFGFLCVYAVKKIDIRNFGSSNIGATNVTRVLGRQWGIVVFILDFLKGFLAPLLVKIFVKDASNFLFIIASIVAVCGHNWTPFLKFKGGKGVSTSLGAIGGLCVIFPDLTVNFVIALVVWVVIFFIFRIVSIASIISTFSFLIFSFIFSLPLEFKIFSLLLFVFILIRHKKNIESILQKKELNF